MEKEIVLFGAGEYGRNALHAIGKDRIAFFVDNNKNLSGDNIEGIEIRYFADVLHMEEYQIIISVSVRYYAQIEELLKQRGIACYYSVDQFLRKKKYCTGGWGKYKNKYFGKRCFLLGSGPSLNIYDLDRLYKQKEICFGANKIFKLFKQTKWRPDIYCATDRRILTFYKNTITDLDIPKMFIACYSDQNLQKMNSTLAKKDNVNLFVMKDGMSENHIEFSENPDEYIVEGKTVIYAMIQIAVFMGFHKIYLLGVDFNYSDMTGYDRNGNDHFCEDYIEEGEEVLISPQHFCLKAFEKAKEYSLQHGIKIYNATRGGKLEVFERTDLDCIIQGEK